MQDKPYFCPNCRSNRVKFSVITSFTQQFLKDPVSGAVTDQADPVTMQQEEPSIQCLVCQFSGNEMRFVKQAEREPRVMTETNPVYVQ